MSDNTRNDINAMRNILFETIRGVKDGSIDVDKATAICNASQTIINSVKAEIDFSRVSGLQLNSEFIPTLAPPVPEKPEFTAGGEVTRPGNGVLVHRMRG